MSYAWAKLYRKSFLDSNKIEFGDYRYAEDKIYNYFCYIAGARYAFIDKKIYVYRRNEQSVSNTYRKDGDKDWMRIAQDLQDKIDSLNYEKNSTVKMKLKIMKVLLHGQYILLPFLMEKWSMSTVQER